MTQITITKYDELTRFITSFRDGYLNMLVICSRGGLGKSEDTRRLLSARNPVHIGGHITPLAGYSMLEKGKDKLVVFDEIDTLLSNATHVGLLKQLCETREHKRVMWSSVDPRAVAADGGKGYFYTRSHVLMLCNFFEAFGGNAAALKTRALSLRFEPEPHEILKKMATFAKDGEILGFLGEFHDAIADFGLRTYRILEDLKSAGLDWRSYALDETNVPPKVREIATLLERYEGDADRIAEYTASRRDYYNWKPEAVAFLHRREVAKRWTKMRCIPAPE